MGVTMSTAKKMVTITGPHTHPGAARTTSTAEGLLDLRDETTQALVPRERDGPHP